MTNQTEKEMGIYTYFDRVAGANQLMVIPNEPMAVRLFTDMINQKGTAEKPNYIREHAEDFVLARLGYINNQTGEIRGEYEEIKEAYDIVKNNMETKDERRKEN